MNQRNLITGILIAIGLAGLITTGLYAAFLHSVLLGFLVLFATILLIGIIAAMAWGPSDE